MPNCQNCDFKWSWLDTAKIGFKNNKKCPNCGERQYISPRSRTGTYGFVIVPLIIFMFSRPLFDLSSSVYILLGILLILTMFIFLPYGIKLSNEQEPLW